MGYTLTLQVPEEIYQPLATTAQRSGYTPEELVMEWITTAMHTVITDPLEEFIGAFASDVPDWADQHDIYLGNTLIQENVTAVEMSVVHA